MKTITLDNLVAKLAESKGLTPIFAEKFVGEFFKTIQNGLYEKGFVVVKGFGRFLVTDDNTIKFEADESLASKINEPFEYFEPIELDDDEEVFDSEAIEEADSTTDSKTEEIESAQSIIPQDNSDDKIEPVDNVESGSECSKLPECENNSNEDFVTENDVEPEINTYNNISEISAEVEEMEREQEYDDDYEQSTDEQNYVEIKKRNRKSFWLGLAVGVVVGVGATWAINKYIVNSNIVSPAELQQSIAVAPIDSINTDDTSTLNQDSIVEPIEPAIEESVDSQPITEIVTSTNYLATMARRHYGRTEFWVYIYLENSDKIKHPDYVNANTVVVIPPAEKYDIDKNDPASIARASAKAKEIYAQYQ